MTRSLDDMIRERIANDPEYAASIEDEPEEGSEDDFFERVGVQHGLREQASQKVREILRDEVKMARRMSFDQYMKNHRERLRRVLTRIDDELTEDEQRALGWPVSVAAPHRADGA